MADKNINDMKSQKELRDEMFSVATARSQEDIEKDFKILGDYQVKMRQIPEENPSQLIDSEETTLNQVFTHKQ